MEYVISEKKKETNEIKQEIENLNKSKNIQKNFGILSY